MAAELQGVAALARQLRELGSLEDGRVIRAAVRKGSDPMVAAARARAPERDDFYTRKTYKGREVGPGFGKRSVRAVVLTSKDKQLAAALIGVSREAFYMVQFVEIGTSFQSPQPWLVPSFEANKSPALDAISKSILASLRRIAKKKGVVV